MSIKFVYKQLLEEYKKLRVLDAQHAAQSKIVETLRQQMLAEMEVAGTTTYNSDLGVVSMLTTEVPVVDDWEAFYAKVLSDGATDLLQRRISTTAWREHVEAGDDIPGVVIMRRKSLRIAAQ